MKTGTVKWFNAKKGFGFLAVDGFDADIFVHYSAIDCDGFRTLLEGEMVDVEVSDDGRGPRAAKVLRRAAEPPASGER